MMKTIKRPVSILLVLLMVAGMFSVLPISAGAVGEQAKIGATEYATLLDALDAAQDGDTVELLTDITLDPQTISGESIKYGAYITKSITLDGNNHTITSAANTARTIGIKGVSGDVDVTIKNVEIDNSNAGAICVITRGGIGSLNLDNVVLDTQGCPSGYNQPLTIGGTQYTQAEVNVTNSTIQTNAEASKYYAIILWNPVDMTITDSTIKGWACVYQKQFESGTTDTTEVTIDNCTLTSVGIAGSSNHFAAIMTEESDFSCVVTNSTINVTAAENTYQGIAASDGSSDGFSVELGEGNDVTLTGDTAIIGFNFDETDHEIAVSGGTFNVPVDEEYCADGFEPVDDGNGAYGVTPHDWDYDNPVWGTNPVAVPPYYDYTVTLTFNCNSCDATKVVTAQQVGMSEEQDPSCGDDGYTSAHFEATVDGHYYNKEIKWDIIPADGEHPAYSYYPALAPTCEAPGNVEYWECPVCLKKFSDSAMTQEIPEGEEVIPATGHDYDYENIVWTFTENASHSIYAKGTVTCKNDPSHTKSNGTSGTLMSTVAVSNGKFVYTHAAVKINGVSVDIPNYERNVADGIINSYELKAAAGVAGNYTLANDINNVSSSGSSSIAFSPVGGFALDGQGHTIKSGTINAGGRTMFAAADQNASFTLSNVTLDGNNRMKWGVCAYTGNSGNNAGNVIDLDNVTIQNFKSSDYVGAINAFGSSTWNLTDCTITGNTTVDDNQGLSGSAIWAGSKSTININGGTYDEVYLHSYSGTGAVLNADGGAAIGNLVLDLTKTDTLKANIDEATVGAITANGDIPEEIVVIDPAQATVTAPEGYKWVDSEESGMKTLVKKVYVAQIGDDKYETLEAAFAAADDGDTIEVLADCSGNGIQVPQGKFNTTGLTVNFNNHTYTVDGTTVGSAGTQTQAFQLLKDNKITFNNGTIYSEVAKMLVQNYSDLTLDGMTLELNNQTYTYPAYTLSNNNGNVVIDDTTIIANNGNSFAFDVCRYASYPSVNVTVTGDSHIYGNVEVYASGSDPKNGFSLNLESGEMNGNIVLDDTAKTAMAADPEKASVNKSENFVKAAPADYAWVSNGDGTESLVAIPYVAKIGDAKYETLDAAVAAATDGATITLLSDCSGNGIKVPQGKFDVNGLTIDFDGYTYTVNGTLVGSTGTEYNAFQLLKDNKITFKDGAIYSDNAYFLIQNYSNLTLDNMTLSLKGQYYNQYTLSNNNGNTVINDSTINAADYSWLGYDDPSALGAVAFDVCRYASYPSVSVTVTGDSVINGDVEVDAGSGDAKDGLALNLNGGTMNGDIKLTAGAETALAATPDKASVNKANTFTQEAPEDYRWEDNGDGTSTLVAIPYVAQIGSAKYETLEAAFAAAQDGETITLLTDCNGNGIKVPQGKFNNAGLTVDFNGKTYTVDGTLVGSTGTEYNAFQLLKDNDITFTNGAIYSDNAYFLIQNYSNLTLDNMTLSLKGQYYNQYTLSNNNGNTVINDSTINAADYSWLGYDDPSALGAVAFDVCRYASYPSVSVTVTGDSVINGDVEVDAGSGDAKDGLALNLNGGTMNGDIKLTAGAETALADTPAKASVNKASDFTQAAPEGYLWIDTATEGVQTLAKAVAKIGNTNYATLEAAFAAAVDGDTITLLDDCGGNGISVPADKFASSGLIVDFNGHTFTCDGSLAGSPSTKSQAFQLLKGNKITFKNGTVYSEKARMLVQNYSDLTLDNMTLTLNNTEYTRPAYTLSNNNGNVVINDTTINANNNNSFAFDVCRYNSYTGVNVTVTGDSQINGNIQIDIQNGDPKNGATLMLQSGTHTGVIDLTNDAKAALENHPETASVNKATTFTQAAPEGYKWRDNGDETQTLVPAPALFDGHNIALVGNINLNFYINPEAIDLNDFSECNSATVSFSFDKYNSTLNLKNPADEANEGKVAIQNDGLYKVTCEVPAAYMAHPITATVTVDGVAQAETNTYSVQQYAQDILAAQAALEPAEQDEELITLVKEMLNYGAKAREVFVNQMNDKENHYDAIADYEMGTVTAGDIDAAIYDANGEYADDPASIVPESGMSYYTTSLIYLSGNTLRHYYAKRNATGTYDGNKSNYYYYSEVTGIPAAELDTLQTFSPNGHSFKYSALDYAKAVLSSNMDANAKNLASALFLYNQAANAYFG